MRRIPGQGTHITRYACMMPILGRGWPWQVFETVCLVQRQRVPDLGASPRIAELWDFLWFPHRNPPPTVVPCHKCCEKRDLRLETDARRQLGGVSEFLRLSVCVPRSGRLLRSDAEGHASRIGVPSGCLDANWCSSSRGRPLFSPSPSGEFHRRYSTVPGETAGGLRLAP